MDIGRIERWYKKFVKRGDLVFDIGANVGHWTQGFANLGCQVIAVEPQQSIFVQLKERFVLNPNIVCVRKAVGSGEGKGILRSPADSAEGRHGVATLSDEFISRLGPKAFNLRSGWDAEESVTITNLDGLIGIYGKPAFIKIDVEGYEFEVIRGLSHKIPLCLEFHPEYVEPAINSIHRLHDLGYTYFNYDLYSDFRFEEIYNNYEHIEKVILNIPKDVPLFGDIYAW